MEAKRCAKCRQVKTIADFFKAGRRDDKRNYYSRCKACKRIGGRPLPNSWGKFTPNRFRIENGVSIIELTDRQGRTIAEALVSVEDLPRVLSRGRWHQHINKAQHTTYVGHSHREGGKCGMEPLHRFILEAPSNRGWGAKDRKKIRSITSTATVWTIAARISAW